MIREQYNIYFLNSCTKRGAAHAAPLLVQEFKKLSQAFPTLSPAFSKPWTQSENR